MKIKYDKDNKLIIHEWFDYNPEDQDNLILEIFQKIYELFIEYPVEKVIVITDETRGAFTPEIQAYIRDVQFPRLMADTKVRFIATVKSAYSIQKIGAVLWQKQFKKGDRVILHDVRTETEAREWLQTIDEMVLEESFN